MYLGVDYYPEHWPNELMEEDMERIKAMGANTVRIGEFAWHLMEPEEGHYDFSYFDLVIEKLKDRNLNIIFGTPTATFPAWLSKKYPEVLAKNVDGKVYAFGGRRIYCYNSTVYRDKVEALVKALVDHYKEEEAIVSWQIDNELGHEGSDQCYCETCHKGFQNFLEEKYETVETMNRTYGTIFWGQSYNRFDEVPLPTETITTHNPSLLVDWAHFRSKSINDFAKLQIDILRGTIKPEQKIIHNLFGGFFNRAYDQNVLAERLDVVAYDNYPVWGGLEKPLAPEHIAMTLDYIRGLKNKNFWVVEELMGAQGHTVIGYLPRPGQASLWAHQAMARGCESLLFFRYRGMTHGAEQFCQGILDSDNLDNERLDEVKNFFSQIKSNESIYESEIKSDIAVLYDYTNRWAWAAQPQSEAFDIEKEILRFYRPFYTYQQLVDVRKLECDLENYKVVCLPAMMVLSDEMVNRLENYVKKGGIVIFGYRSGLKDITNNIRFGCNPVQKLSGIKVKNYESLGHDVVVEVVTREGEAHTFNVWREMIEPVEAESLCQYTDAFYKQYSGATRRNIGNGSVYYIGGGADDALMKKIVSDVLTECGLQQNVLPDGVECVTREGVKILLNHNSFEVTFEDVELKPFEVRWL